MARPPLQLHAAMAQLTEHGEMRGKALADALGVAVENLNPTLRRALANGELLRRHEGRAVFYRLPDQEPGGPDAPEGTPKFNAALWADGELVLWNVDLNDDGRSLTLNQEQVQQLRGLLVGA